MESPTVPQIVAGDNSEVFKTPFPITLKKATDRKLPPKTDAAPKMPGPEILRSSGYRPECLEADKAQGPPPVTPGIDISRNLTPSEFRSRSPGPETLLAHSPGPLRSSRELSPMRERPAETELGTSPLPSPRGGKFSLDLSSLSPFHRLPFSLESHTQQGNDEYHSEENQDRHCFSYDHTRKLAWIGVSDGHVGSGAADFVTTHVVRNISSFLPRCEPRSVEEVITAIREGIAKTEEDFKKVDDASGACLVLACLKGDDLIVANVGDSRAVLGTFTQGTIKAVSLTNDHNASNEGEAHLARFRFLKNQGMLKELKSADEISSEDLIAKVKEVMDGDDIISNGRLFSMENTRTIGDFGTKRACFQVVISEPEFTVHRLSDADHHIILACDGVWKTVPPQRAVELIVNEFANPNRTLSLAEVLVREAVEQGSGDDQTVIVLDLVNYRHSLQNATNIRAAILKGLSIYDTHSAQQVASSAHRTFKAKIALMHKNGCLAGKGGSQRTVFESEAQKTQAIASSVHRAKPRWESVPRQAGYAGLSLFEEHSRQIQQSLSSSPNLSRPRRVSTPNAAAEAALALSIVNRSSSADAFLSSFLAGAEKSPKACTLALRDTAAL